jgi:pSer/pThr/pTyr-binding forkhead associated (FHA) protein
MRRLSREWLSVREAGGSDTVRDLDGEVVRIGRGADSGVVLTDEYVSAAHAELVEHRGERCVRDLGSTNGTRLNGRRLAPRTLHRLDDRDVLQIGECELIYRRTLVSEAGAGTEGARWRRVARMGLLMAACGVVAAMLLGGALWLLAPPRVALLVLGGDARPDELQRGYQGRTDTMLAVVADRSPPGVVLVSIPRDLWVQIPGFGWERINVAYPVGGPGAAKRAASATLGMPFDGYLFIGLQGLRDLVDAAGGVEIDVTRPIHDPPIPPTTIGPSSWTSRPAVSAWTGRRRSATRAPATRTATSGGSPDNSRWCSRCERPS